MDFEKLIGEYIDSCRSSKVGPFNEISVEMRVIKELVEGFLLGLGDPFTISHSV